MTTKWERDIIVMDRYEVIKSILQIEPTQRTNVEQMAYEYHYLIGNIGEICVEVSKLHIDEEKAIMLIREMIGKCYDSLEGVEHVKTKK